MDDLWTDAACAGAVVALARLTAVDPDHRHEGHLRARLAAVDPELRDVLAARAIVADAEAILADHAGDIQAANADALARYRAAYTLARDLRDGPPDQPPDIWLDNNPPPAPAAADHLCKEILTMAVLTKTDDRRVPAELRDTYTRVSPAVIERARRAWFDRTPEHARTSEAWAAVEHEVRLEGAVKLLEREEESARRRAAYEAYNRCQCCAHQPRNSFTDSLCSPCRLVIAAQQAAEAGAQVLPDRRTRADAATAYRIAREI